MIQAIREWLRHQRRLRELKRWERSGRPAPPPHLAKQQIVREHAERYGLRTLVETGTYLGDMVAAMRGQFDTIYSVELSDDFYNRAVERFAGCEDVRLIHGDSGVELAKLTQELNEPALFWLDGHWSAGPTAKGEKETPIAEELLHVLPLLSEGSVALIDDARLFGVDTDYPPIEELQEYIATDAPGVTFEVDTDVIRLLPPADAVRRAA